MALELDLLAEAKGHMVMALGMDHMASASHRDF